MPTPTQSVSPLLNYALILILSTIQLNNDNGDDDFTAFASISVTKHITTWFNKLREYFQKPIKNIKEPLKWWITNHGVYPNLYCMVLDYLSIPGSQFVYYLLSLN